MTTKEVLMLVGSPRPRSSSVSLGNYLCGRLGERGWEVSSVRAREATALPEGMAQLFESVAGADLVLLTTPLYVDSLPAPLIRILEELGQRRQGQTPDKEQQLTAIINCGFPEARHNKTALAICRVFARHAGFAWAGGLALGGGEMLGQKPLEQAGGVAQGIRRSLDLAAAALAEGKPIPAEATDLMAKPAVPVWLYTFMGNLGWRQQAKRYGTRKKLRDRPYAATR